MYYHTLRERHVVPARSVALQLAHHITTHPPQVPGGSRHWLEVKNQLAQRAERSRERALRALREAGFVEGAVLLVEYHDRPDWVFLVEQVREYDMAVRGVLYGAGNFLHPWRDWVRLDDVIEVGGPLVSNLRWALGHHGVLEPEARAALYRITENRRRIRHVGCQSVFR